jgi:ABC-type branched-subunit amino acid transport system ATPase component
VTVLFSARDIVGGYGAVRIVNGVSFDLRRGETLAILGRNGVGKTTLLRTLVGLADRPSGSVLVDGRAVAPRDPRTMARLGVTFVPDDRGVFPRLTIAENIDLARRLAFAPAALDVFVLFPDLAPRRDQPAGTLSGGQQQQLAIARALTLGPQLLIVDELSQGLQPSIVQSLTRALVQATRVGGLALVLVDQNPQLAMQICERVMVMQRGEVVASGASATLGTDKSFLDLLVV